MKGEVIRDICTDIYGNIWVGTEDAGINCLEKKTGTFTNYQPVPGKRLVTPISEAWLHQVTGSDRTRYPRHRLDGYQDEKGHQALQPAERDSLTVKELARPLHQKYFQEGQVYVGTDDGIYKYDSP